MMYTPYQLEDLEKEARQVIEVAKLRAQEMVRSAQAEVERIRTQARTEGIEQGKLAALSESKQRLETEAAAVLGVLKNIVGEVDHQKRAIVNLAEKELVRLAITIAEKVVKHEILSDKSRKIVQQNLRQVIELVVNKGEIEILVSKKDLNAIKKYLPELEKQFMDIGNIRLIEDPGVSEGGCIVRTKEGQINADLKAQIEEIERQLLGGKR